MEKPKRYSNSHLREIVEEFIHSERDRRILIDKYCNKRTMEQIAEIHELSVSQVKRIITRDGCIVFGIMAEEDRRENYAGQTGVSSAGTNTDGI